MASAVSAAPSPSMPCRQMPTSEASASRTAMNAIAMAAAKVASPGTISSTPARSITMARATTGSEKTAKPRAQMASRDAGSTAMRRTGMIYRPLDLSPARFRPRERAAMIAVRRLLRRLARGLRRCPRRALRRRLADALQGGPFAIREQARRGGIPGAVGQRRRRRLDACLAGDGLDRVRALARLRMGEQDLRHRPRRAGDPRQDVAE